MANEPRKAPEANEEVAVLQTNHGRIVLRFFEDKAPKHVENFKKLAREGFYDGTKFHRVIPGFMIQGGDPNSRSPNRSTHGTGGPGYKVKAEFNDVLHDRGILSAARSNDPDSAGSQFFLMVARAPHLDRNYTAYGEVVDGLATLDKIVNLKRDSRDNPLPDNPAILETATIQPYSETKI
jgi:cyclophilin family peptidyl-prolyl cis-trans isomerase